LKPPLHALVSDIDWIAEHKRTPSNDAVDAVGVTLSNRVRRNAPIAEGPMEPHSADTATHALPHNFHGDVWRRRNDDAVELAGHGSDVAVTPGAFHLRGVWVDGKHLVSSIFQLAEHSVRCLVRLPGDTSHSDAPSAKKCRD
jgi:hypothetical protein